MAEEKEQSALLRILEEKDKLIVNIKESSTRQNILNEGQIRLLSSEIQKAEDRIRDLQIEAKSYEQKAMEKEAELIIYKATSDKLVYKIEEIKLEFEKYRNSIRNSLEQIRMAIEKELSEKEISNNKVFQEVKENYMKLEAKLQEVDNYYLNVISEISKKQGLAKKYIRHAMADLQEGLNLLDMAHAEFIKPTKIKEEFSKMVEESGRMFKEHETASKTKPSTVIRNIENVNIQLGEAPGIESLFGDIANLGSTSRSNLENLRKGLGMSEGGGGGDDDGGAGGGSGSGGGGSAGGGGGSGGRSGGSGAGGGSSGGGGGKKDSSKGGGSGAGSSSSGGATGSSSGSASGSGDSGTKSASSRGESGGGNGGGSSSGGSGSAAGLGAAAMGAMAAFLKDTLRTEGKQEVIIKPDRNYAPFNWKAVLTDINLKRFESIITNCAKAEKDGKYIKALNLYKTIREQPSIQKETIAAKMLDDQIGYLEAIVRKHYSTQTPSMIPK